MKRIILFAIVLGIMGMPFLTKAQAQQDPATFQFNKFQQFYRYLNGAYVDTVNNSKLIEGAIKEMLLQLDPHSSYISAKEMVSEQESLEGSFSGIGVEFNVLNDTIIVVNVITGGPAEMVGILPNDRIVNIDGKSAIGSTQTDVPKLLRGPKGSVVEVDVVRRGENRMLDFTITRDDIPINTIDAAYKIDERTGYIRVNRFARNTFREFLEEYAKFGTLDALVLDLRNNGGGLLDQAIELSNFFLPRGSLIVSTEGLRVPPDAINAMRNGMFTAGKVIVLINEASASGSEIVAGAIQDWDRGLLIGRTTFGKGLVQRQFPLIDGSAVRLTVARYHTPTGRVIQRPYEAGEWEQYYTNYANRFEGPEAEFSGDSTQIYKTLNSGRTVYGGGGISPDIPVARDTSGYTEYWSNLVRKGVINEYILRFMSNNRADLAQRFSTIESFSTGFTVDDSILKGLSDLGETKGVPLNTEQLAISKKLLQVQLKALIAHKLWGMSEYFYIMNRENDEVYDKMLEVLQNWNQYSAGITE